MLNYLTIAPGGLNFDGTGPRKMGWPGKSGADRRKQRVARK